MSDGVLVRLATEDLLVRKSGVFTHESILLGQSHQNITPPTMGFRRSMVIWYQINVLSSTKCLLQRTWFHLKRFLRTFRPKNVMS